MKFKVKRSWSLKSKLVVFTSVVFLISIWSLAFFASRMLHEEMEHISSGQQFSTVSFMAEEINEELKSRLKSLEQMASQIDPALLSNPASLQALLEQRPHLLEQFNGGVFATGIDGIAIADVPQSAGRVGVNYLDRDGVSGALKYAKPVIGRPVIGRKLAAPVFGISVPVRATHGRVIGVLTGVITLNRPSFLDKLANNHYGKSGGYLLVAPQHRLIVTATDKRRIMETLPPPGTDKLMDRFIQGYQGSGISVNPHGVEVLSSAKRIPVAGWYVAAVLPTEDAFAPMHAMKNRFILTSIVLTLIACGLIWWMLRRLLSPLLSTVKAISAMADTNQQPQPLPIVRNDEIGTLIMDFNRLLETVALRDKTLRESEEKYHGLFDNSRDAIIILEPPSWAFSSLNQATLDMFRPRDERELLSLRPWDLSPERQPDGRASAEKAIELIDTTIREGYCFFEWTHRRLNGEEFPTEVFLTQLTRDGKVSIQVNIRDITKRKRAEEYLRKSEYDFRMLAESMPQIVWVSRPDGSNIYLNQQWVDYTGLTLEESRDHGWMGAFHPDDKQVAWDAWQNATTNGADYAPECRLRRADGVYRWWLIRGVPVPDEHGTVLKWFGTCTDIDDFKRTSEEKLALAEQFQQAQKMESVGSLAGGVAHDFNNKLTVILGHACLALTESNPDKVRDSLEEIRKAAEQSADLTRQLLAFARKQTIVPKVLNLNEIVSGMLKMLNRLIGEEIRLEWLPADELWLVKLDPSQIDQILANLCVNARDSILYNGKITIETGNCIIDEVYRAQHTFALPGEYVRLDVSDNGCGMDNDTLSRIFEPFFTTKEAGKGTGLGLSMVYGIVKQNNGFIDVSSAPGTGTRFTIYLPRHASQTEQTHNEVVNVSGPLGLETILLVEDELALLNMASMILEKQGYSVLQANSPAEAIRLAKEHVGRIALMITDVIMPEMNGKNLADNLKSFSPELKCLFMSGYTADAISPHGILDEGMNFIQKPFSLPALATKVRAVLDS